MVEKSLFRSTEARFENVPKVKRERGRLTLKDFYKGNEVISFKVSKEGIPGSGVVGLNGHEHLQLFVGRKQYGFFHVGVDQNGRLGVFFHSNPGLETKTRNNQPVICPDFWVEPVEGGAKK
jgi:hypothetical protein